MIIRRRTFGQLPTCLLSCVDEAHCQPWCTLPRIVSRGGGCLPPSLRLGCIQCGWRHGRMQPTLRMVRVI